MVTQDGKSYEHITDFFLNLICMRLLANPKAAEVRLISSLNAMESVGHQTTK